MPLWITLCARMVLAVRDDGGESVQEWIIACAVFSCLVYALLAHFRSSAKLLAKIALLGRVGLGSVTLRRQSGQPSQHPVSSFLATIDIHTQLMYLIGVVIVCKELKQ